jgi:hypothetical protein
LGWLERRNLRIDFLWGQGLPDVIRRHAAELAALAAVLLALLKFTATDGHHSLRA